MPNMQEIVEQMARAVCKAKGNDPDKPFNFPPYKFYWQLHEENCRKIYLEEIALQAMRSHQIKDYRDIPHEHPSI